MAQMLPAVIDPDTPSPGEVDVFRRLRDDPGTADWIVLHSLELPTHVNQIRGEVDFLVLIPGLGFLCIEVKAHRDVRRDVAGMWHMGAQAPTGKSPFQQARSNMFSVLALLRATSLPMSKIPIAFVVMFTAARFAAAAIEWHRWEVVDLLSYQRESIATICRRTLMSAREQMGRARDLGPSPDECRRAAHLLRPRCETITTPADRRRTHVAEVTAFTEMQYRALDAMDPEQNPRVVFEGPAGTGKTSLALEAARREAYCGNRVLLVCFNRLLGHWLAEQVSDLGPNVSAGTLARFMQQLAPPIEVGQVLDDNYWSSDLPRSAADALLDDRAVAPFDVLIVDEAQDLLHQEWLDVLDLSLCGGLSAGRWLLFGDFVKQALYDGAEVTLDELRRDRGYPPVYSLRENCRNTTLIAGLATTLGGLVPAYDAVLRPGLGDPPQYRFYETDEQQQQYLVESLDALAAAGFVGRDIAVLAPSASGVAMRLGPGPWGQRLRAASDEPAPGYVRFATIHAFKGLEARAVILTDIDQVDGGRAESLFYTGLTRATERLVILANHQIRAALISRAEAGADG